MFVATQKHTMQSWRFLLFLLARPFLPGVKSDDCQPHQWKRDVGDIVCRYWATSPAEVNYYTCTQLALKYEETVEDFFFLNPTMDRDCETIQPNTDYCVRGCQFFPVQKPNKHCHAKGRPRQMRSRWCRPTDRAGQATVISPVRMPRPAVTQKPGSAVTRGKRIQPAFSHVLTTST